MSKAIILQHVEHEGPGRIVPVFRDFGIKTDLRRLHKGDEVPIDIEEIRVLVVLGGPMGVADISGGKFPFLEKEVELLKRLIAKDHPVLGICLGAQLIAHAARAKVYTPEMSGGAGAKDAAGKPAAPVWKPEIGWGPVTFPFPGGTEPIVMGLMDGAPMFHWHFDTFDIPRLPPPPNAPPPPAPPPPTGSVLISSSAACKNQAFRFKNRLFGFQYHVELDKPGIEAITAAGAADIAKVLGPDGAAKIREETAKNYQRYERLGDRILQNFVQFLRVYDAQS